MNIAVVSRDIGCWDTVKKIVGKYQNSYDIQMNHYSSCEDFLIGGNADLIILGVKFEGISGIKLKEILSAKGKKEKIIFVESDKDYMENAFGKNVYAYINFPKDKVKLERVMVRIFLEYQQDKYISFRINQLEYRIKEEKILYIQSQDKYSYVVTLDKKYLVRRAMNSWLEILDNNDFVRCHRTYIVNMKYVKIIRKNIILDTNEEIPVSRRRRKMLCCILQERIRWL